MKPQHIKMFMEMAEAAAKYSHAERLKVGSIFVRDGRILSIGINGTPAGTDNRCETEDEFGNTITKKDVIHSEQAGIYKAARDGESLEGATLFVTHSPCPMCALAILSCKIQTVYFKHLYRDSDGIRYLLNHGVIVHQLFPETP